MKNSFIERTYVVGTHRKMNTHAKIRRDKTNLYTFKMPLLPGNKYSVVIVSNSTFLPKPTQSEVDGGSDQMLDLYLDLTAK